MIHFRRTHQISPGRQADAVARAHEWVAIFNEAAGIDIRISVVTTGTLGRLCFSADYESMGAFEALMAKGFGSPKGLALMAKHGQEARHGTEAFVSGITHDEFWRDA